MNKIELTAPCGLDCFNCPSYESLQCATWHCVQEKAVTFCYECGDFPCKLLMPTLQGAQYPHNMKVYNLCRMKLVGVDKWAEEATDIRTRYFNGRFEVGKGPVLEESSHEND